MNKYRFNLVFFILTISLLTGCNSKIDNTISSSDFGNVETSIEDLEESKYAFEGDFNGKFDTKETTKSIEEIEEEVNKELEKINETRDIEQESKEALITNIVNEQTGETVSLLEMEDEIIDKLTDSIINGEITNLDDVEKELSKTEYSEKFKEKIKMGCNELIDYWTERNIELAADPIDPKLVEENEDLRFYTQTEYEEFD